VRIQPPPQTKLPAIRGMEKTAARAWKRTIGGLSDGSRQKLEQAGVLDRVKEIDGLNFGTAEILRKHHAKVFKNDLRGFTNEAIRSLYRQPGMRAAVRSGHGSTKNFRNLQQKRLANNFSFASTISRDGERFTVHQPLYEDVARSTKDTGGKMRPLNNDLNQKHFMAITNRHEADEVRAARRAYTDKKRHVRNADGSKSTLTNIASHISPEVVLHESANAAVAPKQVRKAMMDLRSYGGESHPKDYAVSGLYDKQRAAKATKRQVAINKYK